MKCVYTVAIALHTQCVQWPALVSDAESYCPNVHLWFTCGLALLALIQTAGLHCHGAHTSASWPMQTCGLNAMIVCPDLDLWS
jgi:hypothetical protein